MRIADTCRALFFFGERSQLLAPLPIVGVHVRYASCACAGLAIDGEHFHSSEAEVLDGFLFRSSSHAVAARANLEYLEHEYPPSCSTGRTGGKEGAHASMASGIFMQAMETPWPGPDFQ